MTHFSALPKLPSAKETCEAVFLQMLFLYGLQQAIVWDLDPHIFRKFCRLLGILVSRSSGFNLQTNSQLQRYNQEMEMVYHLSEPLQLGRTCPLDGICTQLWHPPAIHHSSASTGTSHHFSLIWREKSQFLQPRLCFFCCRITWRKARVASLHTMFLGLNLSRPVIWCVSHSLVYLNSASVSCL